MLLEFVTQGHETPTNRRYGIAVFSLYFQAILYDWLTLEGAE